MDCERLTDIVGQRKGRGCLPLSSAHVHEALAPVNIVQAQSGDFEARIEANKKENDRATRLWTAVSSAQQARTVATWARER